MIQAVGFIEAIGLAAAIEAADAAVKSANVSLLGYELSRGSGMVTVKVRGDVGAVKASIEAAKIASSKVNKVYSTLVIPRPADSTARVIKTEETVFDLSGETSILGPSNSEQEERDVSAEINGVPRSEEEGEREEEREGEEEIKDEGVKDESGGDETAYRKIQADGNRNLDTRKKKKGR
jgi:microcompartment protein CcmL/EutN